MTTIETLIEPYGKFGVVGWALSGTTLSIFVTDVNIARSNIPTAINGNTVVIYKSN